MQHQSILNHIGQLLLKIAALQTEIKVLKEQKSVLLKSAEADQLVESAA